MSDIITSTSVERRIKWIEEIRNLSGHFGNDSDRLEQELSQEIGSDGFPALLDHLRLSGDIPESYEHDSSEEKLYSKYTDSLLAESFKSMGLRSFILKERGDAADVDVFAQQYSFVADAKAFRLSRTAKNQKDFKVQAMVGWKRDKPYAMVVAPIYQLPNRSSQIYQQASTGNVCVFTYSHLAVLVSYAQIEGNNKAEELLFNIFESIPALNPSKEAYNYWSAINATMLGFSKQIKQLWLCEKQASVESIKIAKENALLFLSQERSKIMRMSHEEALTALIKAHKLENKIRAIDAVSPNDLLSVGG